MPQLWTSMRRTTALAALVVLASCSGDLSNGTPATTTSTTTSTTITTPTTGPDTDARPDTGDVVGEGDAPCSSGSARFTQDGAVPVATRPGSDAALIDGFSWEQHEGCTRLSIAFTTAASSPAVDPPEVQVTYWRDAAVVHLQLGASVEGSAVVSQLVDNDLIRSIYVVRHGDGTLSVDVHLSAAAFVRVSTDNAPAGIVLDVLAGGDAPEHPAILGEDVVVIRPTGGEAVYPITMSGYLAPGVDDIEASLVGPDGNGTVIDPTLVASGDLWRWFDVVFPSGPGGTVTVRIGDLEPFTLDVGT